MRLQIPYYRQSHPFSCGAACSRMLLAFFGIQKSEKAIMTAMGTNERRGTARGSFTAMFRRAGLKCRAYTKATMRDLRASLERGMPALLLIFDPTGDKWGHYAVAVGLERGRVLMHDPANGKYFGLSQKELSKRWLGFRTRSKDGGWMLTMRKGK
ncbi:C39 family peptidase [Candidatus Peregrinibacteria bacterium]|nr:C39 family peptidase [Candidatus Peregrinibacteria bacterium]